MKIEYNPKYGEAVRDGLCEERALEDYNNNLDVIISTENYINAIRALAVEGKIDYKKIIFVFEGKELILNKYGRLSE